MSLFVLPMAGGSARLGQTSFSRFLRWWFYQHGLYCAKHPRVAAGIGMVVVLLSALGLLNPRGQPFVFDLQASIDNFWSYVHQYAVPRWHAGAYLWLVAHIAWAADSGVKYPMLKRARSVLGLKTLQGRVRAGPQRSQPWSPSFAARFTVGLCGILVVLFSVLLACGVSNSLLGVSMAAIFDELPFLVLFMGVQSVFSLLDASTSTYNETESTVGAQGVVVVDRVNQIALATSLTGPEELLTSLAKAGIALLFCWPLTSLMGPGLEPVADFWVHAGLAVLFKCLLQMSLFASLVQAMLPEWDPARRRTNALLTPDIKCRVCFESGSDLRRCPCKCTGSVGYIHPVCFQQWFETKKSMRCELCHMIFNVRMVPTSVTTNMQTIESLVADLVPPLTKRLALFAVLTASILCNKLGFILVDFLADKFRFLLAQVQPRAGGAAGILKERQELLAYLFTMLALMFPSVAAAVVGVVPRVLREWHRRHRAMHWDGPIVDDCSSEDESKERWAHDCEPESVVQRAPDVRSGEGAVGPKLPHGHGQGHIMPGVVQKGATRSHDAAAGQGMCWKMEKDDESQGSAQRTEGEGPGGAQGAKMMQPVESSKAGAQGSSREGDPARRGELVQKVATDGQREDGPAAITSSCCSVSGAS